MKGTTNGLVIFRESEKCVERADLDWFKLMSVATDGAPVMRSERIGLVGLLRCKMMGFGMAYLIYIHAIHCIIQQEPLCGNRLEINNVMSVVVKTVNFIRSRALNNRQFKSFLEAMDSEYGEILYHTDVRWLSGGNVLKRFFNVREEMGLFMALKEADLPQLGDEKFIADLAFLCDLTSHLNVLNTALQGSTKVITSMFDVIKSFK